MDRGHGQEFRLLLSGRWELSCTSAVSARLAEDKPAAGVVGKKGAGRTQVLKGGAATISALVSLHPLTVTPKYQEPALLSMSAVPSPPTQQPLARWLHFLRCQAAWAGAVQGGGLPATWKMKFQRSPSIASHRHRPLKAGLPTLCIPTTTPSSHLPLGPPPGGPAAPPVSPSFRVEGGGPADFPIFLPGGNGQKLPSGVQSRSQVSTSPKLSTP